MSAASGNTSYPQYYPIKFTIQGFDDHQNWIDIATFEEPDMPGLGEWKYYSFQESEYESYRIFITQPRRTDFVMIGEIEFFINLGKVSYENKVITYDVDGWHVRQYRDGYIEMSREELISAGTRYEDILNERWVYIPHALVDAEYPVPLVQLNSMSMTAVCSSAGRCGFLAPCLADDKKFTHIPGAAFLAYESFDPAAQTIDSSWTCYRAVTGRWK